MTKFQFSLAKVQNWHRQNHRLASMEALQRKRDLDDAVLALQQLDATIGREEAALKGDAVAEAGSRESQLRYVDHLRSGRAAAQSRISEALERWNEAIESCRHENTRMEGCETLRRSERAEHDRREAKAEFNSLMDLTLARKQSSKGDTSRG